MSRKMVCKCGKHITKNTLSVHIKSDKCNQDSTWKAFAVSVLKIKNSNRHAWLKADGKEAIGDCGWFISVIFGETSLEDWEFEAPRGLGQVRPSTAQRMSIERTGAGNPLVRRSQKYDQSVISLRARELFSETAANIDLDTSDIERALKREFPDIWFNMAHLPVPEPRKRGVNKKNVAMAFLLGITTDEYCTFKAKRRGLKIRKGQLASEKFKKVASRIGSNLVSRFRLTKPHLQLFELVRRVDADAELERKLQDPSGIHRSYDIFSPKLNALIEMHGRVWYDISKTKPALVDICKKNMKNDEMKRAMAAAANMEYFVFWDDESSQWEFQLYEIIKNNICKETGSSASI